MLKKEIEEVKSDIFYQIINTQSAITIIRTSLYWFATVYLT